jgi:hypothetical protein
LNTERLRCRRYLRFWRWFVRPRLVLYCHCGSCHGSPSADPVRGDSAGVSGALGSRSRWSSCSVGVGAGGDGSGGACLSVAGGPAALSCGPDTGVAGAGAGLSGGDGSTLGCARTRAMRCSTIRSATAVGSTGRGGGVGSTGGGDTDAAGSPGCTTGAGVRGGGAGGGGGAGSGGGSCSGAPCDLDVNSGLAASSSSVTPRILRRPTSLLISATA